MLTYQLPSSTKAGVAANRRAAGICRLRGRRPAHRGLCAVVLTRSCFSTDEAHQDVFNILLQIMDDGRPHRRKRTVDFRIPFSS